MYTRQIRTQGRKLRSLEGQLQAAAEAHSKLKTKVKAKVSTMALLTPSPHLLHHTPQVMVCTRIAPPQHNPLITQVRKEVETGAVEKTT
jgi:hypothetical protein